MTRTAAALLLVLATAGLACRAEPPAASAPAKTPTLDTREPVPLLAHMAWHQKQNMVEHLKGIEGVLAALASEDFAGVRTAVTPLMTSPQMAAMCNHMGRGNPDFEPMALEFHRRADAVAEAAEKEDAAAVLAATAHTLQACNACHTKFRQEVLTEAEYTERLGSAPQPHH